MTCAKCGEKIPPYEHSGVNGMCEDCYYGEIGDLVEGEALGKIKETR